MEGVASKRPLESQPTDLQIKTKACQHCKRAHKKCEAVRPCARCVSLGLTDCSDAPMKKLGRPKKRRLGETDPSQSQTAAFEPMLSSYTYPVPAFVDSYKSPTTPSPTQPQQSQPQQTTSSPLTSNSHPTTTLLATILEEVKSLASITNKLQHEQAVLRDSLAALSDANPSSNPQPSSVQTSESSSSRIISSTSAPPSPLSAYLSNFEEQIELRALLQPTPKSDDDEENEIQFVTPPNPSMFFQSSAKRFYCQWQQPVYSKPGRLPTLFAQNPYPQQQQPTLLPLKEMRLSSLLGARSNNPLNDLYDLSAASELPFLVNDVSKPLLVMRVDHKSDASSGNVVSTPGHSVTHSQCPWSRIVFSRVAVSRSFCDLLGYTEEELITNPSIEVFYLDTESCEFAAAMPYLAYKSTLAASPILYFTPRYVSKDGNIVTATTRTQVFYNNMGISNFAVLLLDEVLQQVRMAPFLEEAATTEPIIISTATSQSRSLLGGGGGIYPFSSLEEDFTGEEVTPGSGGLDMFTEYIDTRLF